MNTAEFRMSGAQLREVAESTTRTGRPTQAAKRAQAEITRRAGKRVEVAVAPVLSLVPDPAPAPEFDESTALDELIAAAKKAADEKARQLAAKAPKGKYLRTFISERSRLLAEAGLR